MTFDDYDDGDNDVDVDEEEDIDDVLSWHIKWMKWNLRVLEIIIFYLYISISFYYYYYYYYYSSSRSFTYDIVHRTFSYPL